MSRRSGRPRKMKAKDLAAREHRLLASADDPRTMRMCGAKRGYNKAQARTAAARMKTVDGKPHYPYKCAACGEWHVGHRPPDAGDHLYDENGSRVR